MKTRIILTLVAVLWTAASYCQQSKFKISYSHNNYAEWARSMTFLPDSSMIFNANYTTSDSWGVLMLHWGDAGNLMDHKEHDRPKHLFSGFNAGSLLEISTNYYIGGSLQWQDSIDPSKGYAYPMVAKLNLLMDTVWIKHYEIDTTGYYLTSSCFRTKDSSILVAGSVSFRYSNPGFFNFFLIKVDTSGNLLWQKTYGSLSTDERCVSVEELPDSSIVISGMRHYSGSVPNLKYQPWILHTDKDGNVQATKQYTIPSMLFGGVTVKPAKNGYGYWMSGLTDSVQNPNDYSYYHYLARLDDNFNILRRKFFNGKWFTQLWDFCELDNGDVVFCGDKKDSAANNQFGYIAKMDSLGNLQWWQTYHEYAGNDNYLSCVRPAPDGGFVACGSTFGLPDGDSQDAWIIKTDSNGCALVNCTVGIDDIKTVKKEMHVYPNPVSDYVTIAYKIDAGGILSVYDLKGRRIIGRMLSGDRVVLNVTDWPLGLYMIVLRTGDGRLMEEKVLIEH